MDNLVKATALVVYNDNAMNDCISAATDTFEECNDIITNLSTIAESTATSGPYENDSSTSSACSTFQSIVYNDVITQPSDRNRVLLAACYAVVDNFNLGAEPYKSQKKFFPYPENTQR